VGQVFQANSACGEGGMGLTVLHPNPPAVLVEAMQVLRREINRAQSWAHEERMKRHEGNDE